MAATSKRIADLEVKLETVVPARLTASQKLAAERYVVLLVRGRKIPATLQKQVAKLPPEELSPVMRRQIEWEEETFGKHGKQDPALKRQRKGK